MLLIVKGALDDDDDEEVQGEDAMQYDDGAYVSGNTPCEVVDWKVGEYVRVAVSRAAGVQMVKVPLVARTRWVGGRLVTVWSYGLKGYLEPLPTVSARNVSCGRRRRDRSASGC